VERTLQGHAGEVKEYTVALEVFDRPARFDSEADSIVRVEARKLRASLDKYYATIGAGDVLVIRVPKGSYAASFSFRAAPGDAPGPVLPRVANRWQRVGTLAILLALIFTAGVAISTRWSGARGTSLSNARPNSLAVLPFRSLSGEKADEYFADGLTDQLIHLLGGLRGLRVIAPSSLGQFKNPAPDVRQIGQVLGTSIVVEGSVQRVNGKVRITVRGCDTLSGQQLWSRTYDHAVTDLASVPDEVARDVANALLSRGVALDEAILGRRSQTTPEAYQRYLQGLSGYDRSTRQGLETSIEDLRLATAADPQYAAAYSALADSYVALSIYSFWPPQQAAGEARRNAERAVALDPSLGDPDADLGFVAATYDWNPLEAERHFRRAIEMNPSCAHCRGWYALYSLAPAGRYEEARQQVIEAEALDPLNPTWPSFRIAVAAYSGRFDQALEEGRRIATPENHDFRAHATYATVLRRAGRIDEALAEARRAAEFSGNHPLALRILGAVLGWAGHRDEALAVLAQLEQQSQNRYVSPTAIAVIHDSVGDHEAFLQWLSKAVETRDPTLIFLPASVDLSADRDPRLRALLAKVVILR
jgi:serine/threonine-protein kinase